VPWSPAAQGVKDAAAAVCPGKKRSRLPRAATADVDARRKCDRAAIF